MGIAREFVWVPLTFRPDYGGGSECNVTTEAFMFVLAFGFCSLQVLAESVNEFQLLVQAEPRGCHDMLDHPLVVFNSLC